MANQKKLQKAAIKFRKENPRLHFVYSAMLSRISKYIKESRAAEVTVNLKDGEYYEYANN